MIDHKRLECLTVALTSIESCQKNGTVSTDDLGALSSAIALGIAPPAVLGGKQPFARKDLGDIAPGTWPHFAQALEQVEFQKWDAAKLEEAAKAGDERAAKRLRFVRFLLAAVRGAVKFAKDGEEREMRRAVSEAQRKADEAQRKAKETAMPEEQKAAKVAAESERKASDAKCEGAREGLWQAALHNNAKPATLQLRPRPPQGGDRQQGPHQPLPLNHKRADGKSQVVYLIDGSIKRNKAGGEGRKPLSHPDAIRSACLWVLDIVVRDAAKYTEKEIRAMKEDVWAAVTSAFMVDCHSDFTAAEQAAGQWMTDKVRYLERKLKDQRQGRPQQRQDKPAPAPAVASKPAPEAPTPPLASGGAKAPEAPAPVAQPEPALMVAVVADEPAPAPTTPLTSGVAKAEAKADSKPPSSRRRRGHRVHRDGSVEVLFAEPPAE